MATKPKEQKPDSEMSEDDIATRIKSKDGEETDEDSPE